MANAYQERTIWADIADCNHIYLLDGDKMLAYIRKGTSHEFWFKNPIRISRSGRKFDLLADNPFTGMGGRIQNTREVQGSKGAVYIVNLDDNSCTCPGYTFRGACKHVKELEPA
jgi:hypothetical protein